MALTPQQIAQMKADRDAKLKSLSSVSKAGSGVQKNAAWAVNESYAEAEKESLIAYKVNLRVSDRDYLRDYVYTMTQRLGRLYTMTEAIEDAVKSIRENTNFNIAQSPKTRRR